MMKMKQGEQKEKELIKNIQEEEKKYSEVIKDDQVFEEAKKIRDRIKVLKELIKFFPGNEEKE